jgi:hypothetical protein
MIDFSGLKDLFGQQSFPFGAPAAMAPNDRAPYAAPEMRVAAAPGEAGPMGPAVPEGLLAKSPLPPGAPAIPVLGGAESVGPPMPPATGVPSSPASAAAPSGFQKLMNDPEFGKSVGQLVKAAGGGKHAPMPAMQAPGGVPQFTPRRF